MTSATSLKGNHADLRQACKQTCLFPILTTVLLLFYYPVWLLVQAGSNGLNNVLSTGRTFSASFAFCLVPDYRSYFDATPLDELFGFNGDGLRVFLPALLMALCGVLTALLAFRMLRNVPQINFYFSGGVGRGVLFRSRFIAAAALLALPALLPLAVDCAVNIRLLGFSWDLLVAGLHTALGLWFAGMIAFAVTAAVQAAVGGLVEAFFLSSGLFCLPFLLVAFVQQTASLLLRGFSNFLPDSVLQSDWLHALWWTNPLALVGHSNKFLSFNMVYLPGEGRDSYQTRFATSWADWLPFLLWAAVLLLLYCAGKRLLARRPAEIAGVTGQCRPANLLLSALAALAAWLLAQILLAALQPLHSPVEAIALSVLAAPVAWLAVQWPLCRSLKKTLRLWKPGLAALAGCGVLTVAVGLLGQPLYARAQPDASQVKEAYISLPYSDPNWSYASTPLLYLGYNYSLPSMMNAGPFTSEQDIQRVLDLHKDLIEDSTPDQQIDIEVVYRLHDGSYQSRFYKTISNQTAELAMQLADSSLADQYAELWLTKNVIEANEWVSDWNRQMGNNREEWRYTDPSLLAAGAFSSIDRNATYADYGLGSCLLYAPDGSQRSQLNFRLSYDAFAQLKQCVLKDLQAQTSEQRYRPNEQPLGYLVFGEGEASGYNAQDVQQLETDGRTETVPGKTAMDTAPLSLPGLVLTDSTSYTMQFIKQHGLEQLLQTKPPAYALPEGQAMHPDHMMSRSDVLGDFSTLFQTCLYDKPMHVGGGVDKITDPDELTQLLKDCRPLWYDDGSGEVYVFVHEDGTTWSMYLPNKE